MLSMSCRGRLANNQLHLSCSCDPQRLRTGIVARDDNYRTLYSACWRLRVKGRTSLGQRPASACLGPLGAEQHLRAVDLVDGACSAGRRAASSLHAADAQGERLARHARGAVHTRNLQDVGHVLGVVDLVEERLLVRRPRPC